MTKETPRSNPWKKFGKKFRDVALATALSATLLTWAWCGPQSWKEKEKIPPKIEQNDSTLEKTEEKKWIVKNPDWTYSFYHLWSKVWENYRWIEELGLISWFKGYKWYRGDWTECLLNEVWDQISWYYDNIVEISTTVEWELSYVARKEWNEYFVVGHEVFWPYDFVHKSYERWDGYDGYTYSIWDKEYIYHNWNVVGPMDDINYARVVEWSENWLAIIGKNNWKTVLYYEWKQIWELPAKYNSDCMVTTLSSVKLVNEKISYIIYNEDGVNPTIVVWNQKIKAKYNNVENVQEYDWKIIYVWYNYEDWKSPEIFIVSGDKITPVNESLEKITDPKTSLAFYTMYWYAK